MCSQKDRIGDVLAGKGPGNILLYQRAIEISKVSYRHR